MPMRRKQIRLKEYNYSQAGYYFVTICTKNKKSFLSEIVGVGFHADPFPCDDVIIFLRGYKGFFIFLWK